MVIVRYHDHAHLSEPDFIHAGFIRDLGLDIKNLDHTDFGVNPYELPEPMTVVDLAKLIREKIGVANPHIVGNRNKVVKKIFLGLGWVNSSGIEKMLLPECECDLMITGENNEVFDCEYLRDAVYFGADKAMIMLGHCGSEYSGMRYLAEWMTERFGPTEYIHSGGLYTTIDDANPRMR